jgi:hypothetical protein
MVTVPVPIMAINVPISIYGERPTVAGASGGAKARLVPVSGFVMVPVPVPMTMPAVMPVPVPSFIRLR